MKPPDLDSTTDLGVPPGLRSDASLCNYQWAIEGPRGAVVFYCMNEKPCDGFPHMVKLGDEVRDCISLTWWNAGDRLRRDVRAVREAAAAEL
jgi:hypothetical protein